jgi:serine/threonine protein kinase
VGDFTPKPIGYIEFYENFLLNESYFLSEYFEYDFTIREPLLDKNFKNKDEIFKAFARFAFALHEKNIFHKDFSPGNILVKQMDEEYIFKIVDINRMKFQALSFNLRAKSFSKLWADDEDLKTVSNEYAKIYGVNEELFTKKTLHYSHQLKKKMNFKKRLKGESVVN